MKILLNVNGLSVPLIIVDDQLDLSSFSEPTLSILQSAFNSGNYTIIEDPEIPKELPAPDWKGFEITLNSNQDFINYGISVNGVMPFVNATLITKFNSFVLGEITIEQFQFYFETFCQIAQVSPEHRNEWVYAAQQFNLPPEFVAAIQSN